MIPLSCKDARDRQCLKGAGDDIIEFRDLTSFRAVVLQDHIDLELNESSTNSLTLYSKANLTNFITTDIVNDTLYIKDENKCIFLRDMRYRSKIQLSSTNLEYLLIEGSGDVTNQDTLKTNFTIEGNHATGKVELTFDVDSLDIIINVGITKLDLSGKANRAYYYYFGNANLNAQELIADNVSINWYSTGWLRLYADSSLTGELNSSGDVYYSGSPSTLNVGINGSGQLIGQ